jgi:hypothetical protein
MIHFSSLSYILLFMFCLWGKGDCSSSPEVSKTPAAGKPSILFAISASSPTELHWALVAVASLREFGGAMQTSPVWLYVPEDSVEIMRLAEQQSDSLRFVLKTSRVAEEAKSLWYSFKVFASARAEVEAVGKYDLLAWLDPDVIFVNEPRAFALDSGIALGYRPVMHKVIGSSITTPPDRFWTRVYELFSLPDSAIFPVTTPVDRARIRAYFNAGMMIVRPERGILAHWPICFATLYRDSAVAELCRQDQRYAIFLHQVALVGAVLTEVKRKETREFPATYNYPLNLADKYPVGKKPILLDNLVAFRHDLRFNTPADFEKIKDSSKILDWVKGHLPRPEQ